MLKCIIIEQMENDEYSIENINIYISDLKNEKLGNNERIDNMILMTNDNIKYWVSELSDDAQKLLVNYCKRKLKVMGYSDYEIKMYIDDIQNEKLINLEELVSKKLMIKYSSM